MNKYQDALDRLKHINLDLILEKLGHEVADEVSDYGMCNYPNLEMSYDIDAIQELVDRATPKKCEEKEQIVNGISIIHAVCPNCGIEIDEFEHFKGCPYCLQALDWSDEE